MLEHALLISALMLGGTVLYSFGFPAFVFNALAAEAAGPLIRRAFPHFYLFVMASYYPAHRQRFSVQRNYGNYRCDNGVRTAGSNARNQ